MPHLNRSEHLPAAHATLAELFTAAQGLRMKMRDAELIDEALAINHAQVPNPKTLSKYEKHLIHFSSYLQTAHGTDFYGCTPRHAKLFMSHLQRSGGPNPDKLRLTCGWCRDRGYPNGRNMTAGWSPSTCKSYLSAARFLYTHFVHEDDLPSINPTLGIRSPKVVIRRQYTPTRDDIQAMLDAPGAPKDKMLAHWAFYAPSRRQTYVDALWRDIDLDRGIWDVVGKGEEEDCWELHPLLVRQMRQYLDWVLEQATRSRAIREAMSDPETAYVLLTRTGRKTSPQTVTKLLKWRAQRAGVAVVSATSTWDAPGGRTSRMSPHAMRRAWADAALNDPVDPVPIDVVSEVLKHKDIATTRRHYARTKPERARSALRGMKL